MNEMFCKYCGNQIDDNSQFCVKCGNKIQANATAKTSVDLWLILTIVSVLLLILSISVSQSWGETPLNQLDTEDTIPSALLGIAALGVSGFNFYNAVYKRPFCIWRRRSFKGRLTRNFVN